MKKNFIYPIFFQDSYGKEHVIEEVQTMDEALDAIREFLDEHEYKSYYTRFWLEETEYENEPCVVLTFDVGSWSEFFHIYFDNEYQANQFRDTLKFEKPF